jgi:hypothetical protein
MECAIPAYLSTFQTYYPLVNKKVVKTAYVVTLRDPGGSLSKGQLDGWVTALKNENPNYTTCCIQMSHAINMAFYTVDATKMVGTRSVRRKTRSFKIAAAANREFHYIAAVDEMKVFLTNTFGEGGEISRRGDGKPASRNEAKSSILGRPGIVVFMNHKIYGEHTEIWTGFDFHQPWMKGRADVFDWAPVWFWDMKLLRSPV